MCLQCSHAPTHAHSFEHISATSGQHWRSPCRQAYARAKPCLQSFTLISSSPQIASPQLPAGPICRGRGDPPGRAGGQAQAHPAGRGRRQHQPDRAAAGPGVPCGRDCTPPPGRGGCSTKQHWACLADASSVAALRCCWCTLCAPPGKAGKMALQHWPCCVKC